MTGHLLLADFAQFLTESILVALFALASLIMLFALKPVMLQLSFARLMKWDLEANYGLRCVCGVCPGGWHFGRIVSAVVLSGFQPIKVLKNLGNVKLFSNLGMRKALLVSQFTFSPFSSSACWLFFNQLQLFMRADHGFGWKTKSVYLNNTSADASKRNSSNTATWRVLPPALICRQLLHIWRGI